MIDYEKLKLAHELANELSLLLNRPVGVETYFLEGSVDFRVLSYGCMVFETIDQMISYLECWKSDLNQIKQKSIGGSSRE